MPNNIKAIGLLSGGLDSVLALKLVKDQNVEVIAVHFLLPFADDKQDYAGYLASQLGTPLIKVKAAEDYIELVRHPSHGRGSGMNPCIDCRIYMLRQSWQVAQQIGARFLVTGDVLGQRPMTQRRGKLAVEEKESGLEKLILRPLSSKLLPKTLPEEEGWVDRERFLALEGRSRKPQLALARELGIQGYRTPGGGCLLTNKEISFRLQELFRRYQAVTEKDIALLKIGRHFFLSEAHIIVGRNEKENHQLLELRRPDDQVFEVVGHRGPTTILRGAKTKEAVEFATQLTARYSKQRSSVQPAEHLVISSQFNLPPEN
ncbi:MAG: tRNA 4-thiouridine(8) synthase ThiI [Dehalococcoidia bacterium]|nr:tRNA 4-thiouridine(8) synthase ThiI [Dehalococcoidia bacterium]RLC63193.1 MAG: tRNA 4-thiouridine(8) synthase ThiI [Chloroflexota bacterium]